MSKDIVDARERTWVERHLSRDLTEFQRRCVLLLCNAMGTGVYNINCNWKNADWQDRYVSLVVSHTNWSTFDFDKLTRLVIGAHEDCIRVEMEACAPGRMRIMMHRRQREGRMYERHPDIYKAIVSYRQTT